MVRNWMARNLACGLGLGYDCDKLSPIGITQKVLNVACQPLFDTTFSFLGMLFELIS